MNGGIILELAILIAGIIILSVADYLYIRREQIILSGRRINIKGFVPDGWKQIIYFVFIPLSLLAIALMYNRFYHFTVIYTLKRLSVVAVLWPISISDFRDFRIPNKLIVYGFILRVPLLIAELIFQPDSVVAIVINEVVAIVGAVIVCLVCMFLSRGSLGMGDLKLLMFMSAFLGVEGICYTMFLSIFFSAVIAIGFLIFKKKSRKDAIPFAPFILVGTIVCLMLTGV